MTVIDKKIYTVTTAAATFIVDYDNFSTEKEIQSQPFNRTITKYAIVGSTNPADAGGKLIVGGNTKATIKNTSGGANLMPLAAKDWISCNIPVPAGAVVEFIVDDAAAANDVVMQLEIGKYVKPKRRTSSRRRWTPRRPYYPTRRRY